MQQPLLNDLDLSDIDKNINDALATMRNAHGTLLKRAQQAQEAADVNWQYIERIENYMIGNNLLVVHHEGDASVAAQNVVDSIEALRTSAGVPAIKKAAEGLVAERHALFLEQKANRLAPEGKRINQFDRHVAEVLRTTAAELRAMSQDTVS